MYLGAVVHKARVEEEHKTDESGSRYLIKCDISIHNAIPKTNAKALRCSPHSVAEHA
jgi:hypothetical protein